MENRGIEMDSKAKNEFQIITPGALTTVQDYGRSGYGSMGITSSGAVDRTSMEVANLLVGNRRGEAVLECTLLGPTLEFHTDGIIALTGADMQAKLSGKEVPIYEPFAVHPGDRLQLGLARTGCRGYLAFAGGMDIPEVLGSRSLNLKCSIGGGFGRALQAHDTIGLRYSSQEIQLIQERNKKYDYTLLKNMNCNVMGKQHKVRVIMGPQQDYFTEEGIHNFLCEPFIISNDSNRMACKLIGQYINYTETTDIISDGIALGSVQVSSNGQPIVMLSDRQTTGGYAKIATVISTDIPILAQCKPQDEVLFEAVSLWKAQFCFRHQEKKMRRLEKKYGLQ